MLTEAHNKVTINDGFIQDIILDISKKLKVSKDKLQEQIELQVQNIQNQVDTKLKINEGILNNAVESAIFNIILGKPEITKDIDFSLETLTDLFDNIKASMSMFFPLRSGNDNKIVQPSIFLNPSPSFVEVPSWAKTIDTAAAGPDGSLVFNTNFCKALIYYAEFKKPKIQSKIISDYRYSYIAFLIIHELLHINHGDTRFGSDALVYYITKNKKKYQPLIDQYNGNIAALASYTQNIVGDFISNNLIIKMGLPELPIGLFNDSINYDKMTMEEMWEQVLNDMLKQAKENKNNQIYNEQQDDHIGEDKQNSKQNNGASSDQSESQAKQQQNQNSQSGSGQSNQNQDSQSSSDQSDQNQDSQSGSGQSDQNQDNSDTSNNTQDVSKKDAEESLKKTEKNVKSVQDKIKEASEKLKNMTPEEVKKELEKLKSDNIKKSLDDIKDKIKSSGSLQDISFDDSYEAKYTWKQIVKKMTSVSSKDSRDTYSKPSKRNAAGLLQMKQTGKGVLKPGVTEIEGIKKNILLVMDNSGSTMSALGKINKEFIKLIEKGANDIGSIIAIKFDTKFSAYTIDIKNKKYSEIVNPLSLIKPSGAANGKTQTIQLGNKKVQLKTKNPKNIIQLFSSTDMGGGTDFSLELVKVISFLMQNNTDCILFSDTDILWENNMKNLNKLMIKFGKKPFKLNIIMTTKRDFDEFINKFKAYKYLSHF